MQKLLLLVALSFSFLMNGQTRDALIYFTDKPDVATAIANPITILSQKAIDRKNLHNVTIDERDVPINEMYKTTIKNQPGITVLAKSKWLNAVYVRGNIPNIRSLGNLDFVTQIEFMDRSLNRNFQPKVGKDKFEIENRPTDYNYGYASNQLEMIEVDALHDENFDGNGITIAFMDNGYPNVLTNRAYSSMRNEGRLIGTYDFVDRVASPTGTGSHGAATLSTAAALLDGEFVGSAPKAAYHLFITEDGRQESPVEEAWWIEALERADSLGVFVTSTSLGYLDFDVSAYDYTFSELDGFTALGSRGANIGYEKGMLNVVSAGNEGRRSGYVTSPADAPGAFTVGAVDMYGNYAEFSSRGPNASGRIKPDVMAQGEGTAIVSEYGNVTYSNGTSFSGPIIAGAMASLWQAAPHLKNEVIMQAVRESADRYNNPTDEMGYGIPNFSNALTAIQTLGIEDQMHRKLFSVYPNPVVNELNISFPENIGKATIAVYNVLGKKIMEQEVTSETNKMNLSHLNSGVYLVSITAENKTSGFKIIKQ